MSSTNGQPEPLPPQPSVPERLPEVRASERVPMRPPEVKSEPGSQIPIALILHAIWNRLVWALPAGLVLAAAVVGTLYYSAPEPEYRASAWLRITDQRPYLAFPSDEQSSSFAQTQIELIRSPVVAKRAVEVAGIADLPEVQHRQDSQDIMQWLLGGLSVRQIARSELYEIAFHTHVPESAAAVVNAVVETYSAFEMDTSSDQRKRVLQLLDGEQALRQRDIELKQEQLRTLARDAAGSEAVVVVSREEDGKERPAVVGSAILANLQSLMAQAEVDAQLLRAEITAMREAIEREAPVPQEVVEKLVSQDPQIEQWEIDLKSHEETLAKIPVTPLSADTRAKYQIKIDTLKADIAKRKETLPTDLMTKVVENAQWQRKEQLFELEAQLKGKEDLVAFLSKKIADERALLVEAGDKGLEMEFARADLARAEDVYHRIADRTLSLNTEARAPSQVQVVEKAEVPRFPIGMSLDKKLLVFGAAAFCLPFGLVVLLELWARKINDADQLRREIDLDFIGEISSLPVQASALRIGRDRHFERQSLVFQESVNSLRTALALNDQTKDCKVVVVASAVSGEGKTNLAGQLAISWARGQSGNVLVIDADMRSPSLHQLFEVSRTPGLADVLRGEATLQEAIVTDWGEDVHILPAGNLGSSDPDRLVASRRFARLLAAVREGYSRIVIDVPPVLSANETMMLAKAADGVLLCTLRDFSRSHQVKTAYQRLRFAGANVIGAVLNGTPTRRYVYYYGRYEPS